MLENTAKAIFGGLYLLLTGVSLFLIYNLLFDSKNYIELIQALAQFLASLTGIAALIYGYMQYLQTRRQEDKTRKDNLFIEVSKRLSSENILESINAITILPVFFDPKNINLNQIYQEEAINLILNKLLFTANNEINDKKNVERVCIETLSKINEYFSKAKKPFPQITITWRELKNTNLKSVFLNNSRISYCNFENANLSLAFMDESDLEGSKFRNANLKNIYLRNSKLEGCDFSGADLTDAKIEGADLNGTQFVSTILIDASLNDHNEVLFANFNYCIINKSNYIDHFQDRYNFEPLPIDTDESGTSVNIHYVKMKTDDDYALKWDQGYREESLIAIKHTDDEIGYLFMK